MDSRACTRVSPQAISRSVSYTVLYKPTRDAPQGCPREAERKNLYTAVSNKTVNHPIPHPRLRGKRSLPSRIAGVARPLVDSERCISRGTSSNQRQLHYGPLSPGGGAGHRVGIQNSPAGLLTTDNRTDNSPTLHLQRAQRESGRILAEYFSVTISSIRAHKFASFAL